MSIGLLTTKRTIASIMDGAWNHDIQGGHNNSISNINDPEEEQLIMGGGTTRGSLGLFIERSTSAPPMSSSSSAEAGVVSFVLLSGSVWLL